MSEDLLNMDAPQMLQYTRLSKRKKEIRVLRIDTDPFQHCRLSQNRVMFPMPLATQPNRAMGSSNIEVELPENSVLNLCLEVIPLDEAEGFMALSYTWGDEADRRDLSVNGTVVSVTKSLFDAIFAIVQRLIASQTRGAEASFWADAICINQKDTAEKEQQVELMAEIYARAEMVWAHIGQAESVVEQGIGLIKALNSEYGSLNKVESIVELPTSVRQRLYLQLIDERLKPNWLIIENFFNTAWWSRVWTVQEAVVARSASILYGQSIISLDDVLFVAELLEKVLYYHSFSQEGSMDQRLAGIKAMSHHMIEGSFHAFLVARQRRLRTIQKRIDTLPSAPTVQQSGNQDTSQPMPHLPGSALVRIMSVFQHRNCKNPLDRIYGFLGLCAASREPSLISIDYKIEVAELWRRLVRAHMALYNDLSILDRVGAISKSDPAFSSWAGTIIHPPSWPEELEVPELGIKFCSSGGRESMCNFVGTSLIISGIVCDTILRLGRMHIRQDNVASDDDQMESFLDWKAMLASHMSINSQYPTGETCLEAFRQTMLMDPFPMDAIYNKDERKKMLCKNGRSDPDSGTFLSRLLIGRRFFITTRGYFGFGPADSIISDTVVIMHGASKPYLLRRKTNCDFIVGWTCVHGLMLGEAFAPQQREICSEEIFVVQ